MFNKSAQYGVISFSNWLRVILLRGNCSFLLFIQGQIHGWSRAECDSAFHDDMVSICRSRKVKSSKRFIIKWVKKVWVVLKDLKSWALAHRKDRCVKMAKTYYTGVKEFGESHFEERSPDWCERKHAIKRGNPDNLLTL